MSERPELAEFLRARRESLRPADVGLPGGGRRRTPGLRREEVATLAGVSIDYLVRLEQGRDLHPSAGVLAALAGALRLTDDERRHLAVLAAQAHTPDLCPEPVPLRRDVAPGVRHLLDSLHPAPAFVIGPAGHLLAWNRAWEMLVTPLGLLDGAEPNLARYVFADARAHTVYPDWSAAADEQVARLRAAEPRWGTDVAYRAVVDELSDLPEFATRWAAHPVAEKHRGVKRLDHPGAGELRVAYEVLVLPDDEQRLVTWRPADPSAAAAFDAAIGETQPSSPARLAVVSNQ